MKKKRMKSEDRRRDIIAAAIRVIARTSFEKATTVLIAREAGVTEPLLYHHFKTKRDLQLAALDQIIDNLREIFEDTESLENVSLNDLQQIGRVFRERINKDPDQARLFLKAISVEDDAIKEKSWQLLDLSHRFLKNQIRRTMDSCQWESMMEKDLEYTAWLILGWNHLMSVSSLLGKTEQVTGDRFTEFAAFLALNARLPQQTN